MSQGSLEHAFGQLLEAIDQYVTMRLRVPALILLYSTIDIAGWLYSDKRRVQLRFTEWVDKYLLPGSSLECTAIDLYGARCGVIHSYSPASDLTNAGKVKQLAYAWLPSRAANLQKLVTAKLQLDKLAGRDEDPNNYFIAIQVEDLIGSVRKGVEAFLGDLKNDAAKAAAAHTKAGATFMDLSAEAGADMLEMAEKLLRTAAIEQCK